MTKNYQKGETLIIHFKEEGKKITTVGLVLGFSDKKLYLGHNFSGTDPIDSTSINIESILFEERIKIDDMKEIRSLVDLK